MKKTRTGCEVLQATVTEMAASIDSGDIEIPVNADQIKGILERDDKPMFVTLQVMREGVSKNRRRYSRAVLDSVAEQINANHPDGYKGHLKVEDEAYAAPDPETVWLGAVVKEINGTSVLYAKGYVMPYSKRRRTILQTAKDLGKKVAVSIRGKAQEAVYNATDKAYDIRGLVLESIDWARPGAEGIPNDGTLILTSEMVGSSKPKQGDPMEKQEVLKGATVSEMRQHNPDLVKEIEGGVTAVAEMANVRQALGVADTEDPTKAIAEMQRQAREHELTDELRERVKVPQARPVIKQMVIGEMAKDANTGKTVSEMVQSVLNTDDAKAIISSKSGAPNISPANDDKREATARRFTKIN